MSTLLPGSGQLGLGLNMYGPLNGTFLGQVYNMDAGSDTYTLNSVPFSIPKNAAQPSGGTTVANATTYDSREEYDSHFAASLAISGSYMGFSAEADASFDKTVDDSVASTFATLRADIVLYDMDLAMRDEGALSANITGDPDYQAILALPANYQYTTSNLKTFLPLFQKFGTHFISSVRMGGRIEYSVATHTSSTYTSQQVQANITAEYNGVLAHVSAQASTDFTTADQNWFNNTQRHVWAAGGSDGIIAAVMPAYNDNHNDAFQNWLTTVESSQAALLGVQATSIDKIFSGSQAVAVQAALADYVSRRIESVVSHQGSPLSAGGTSILSNAFNVPVTFEDSTFGRMQITVLERSTLGVVMAQSWDIPSSYDPTVQGGMPWPVAGQGPPSFFDDALAKLNAYTNTNNIVVVSMVCAIQALDLLQGNPPKFRDFLLANCGAGSQLQNYFAWQTVGSDTQPIWRQNYGLIGSFGTNMGTGFEQYSCREAMQDMMTFPDDLSLSAYLNMSLDGQGTLVETLAPLWLPAAALDPSAAGA